MTTTPTYGTFDDNWNKLDTASRGFIYGRDLPSLVRGASKLDSSGLKIIEKFSEEQPFYKLYRSVISGVLRNLVGMSVEEMGFVGDNDGGKTSEKGHDRVESDERGLPSREKSAVAGTTAIGDEIERLQKIIEEKDALIELKNEELTDLTRELKLYKEKFKYIVKEFTFYRQNADMKRGDNTVTAADGGVGSDNNTHPRGATGTRPKIKTDLRIEFFKNEFKRQLDEQATIIKDLRQRLRKESGLTNTQFFGNSSSSSKSSTDTTDSESGQDHILNISGIPFWPMFTKSTTTVMTTLGVLLAVPLFLGLMNQLATRTSAQHQQHQSFQPNGSDEYPDDKLVVFPPFIENSLGTPDHLLLYEEQDGTYNTREQEVSPIRRLGSFVLQILGIEGGSDVTSNYFVDDDGDGDDVATARARVDQGRLDAYNQIFGLL